ncbi:hypothetical protein ABZZ74_39380 [Streptomyces sp. NPDC006476]|uniref:hypothetical protein n=1 Tax=Streptomyces sp. NPDC006476 TaxID=3157175 RepID=UPI0033AACDB2
MDTQQGAPAELLAVALHAADLAPSSLAVARAMGAEGSGAPAALGPVLRATARCGTLVQVGNLPGTAAPAALGDLVTREITACGTAWT